MHISMMNNVNSTEKRISAKSESLSELPIDRPLKDELVEKYIDAYPEIISMNEHLNIEFIRKWKEKLDWRVLTANFQFSESELLEFFGSINWKSAVYCQEKCTQKFIKDNNLDFIVEELKDKNDKVLREAESRLSNVDRNLVICEENREFALDFLVRRINGKLLTDYPSDLDIAFGDNRVFVIESEKIESFLRDLKIETIENDDVLDAIRKVTVSFASNVYVNDIK